MVPCYPIRGCGSRPHSVTEGHLQARQLQREPVLLIQNPLESLAAGLPPGLLALAEETVPLASYRHLFLSFLLRSGDMGGGGIYTKEQDKSKNYSPSLPKALIPRPHPHPRTPSLLGRVCAFPGPTGPPGTPFSLLLFPGLPGPPDHGLLTMKLVKPNFCRPLKKYLYSFP